MIGLLVVLEILGALRAYRVVGGPGPPVGGAVESVEWVRTYAQPRPVPRCFVGVLNRWSCWALRDENPGVIVLHGGGVFWWRLSDSAASPQSEPARWGRLIVISSAISQRSPLRVSVGHPVAPPPARVRAMRLHTKTIPGARTVFVAPDVIWIAGGAIPPKAWVEIVSETTAPVYLALDEIAAAPVSVPLHVALGEARPLAGRVLGPADRPAPGALIATFRLIDPPPDQHSRALPRRVLTAESIADEHGRFAVPALGNADYEIVAWHGQLGRASLSVQAADREVVIRLRGSGIARGRVLAGGRPLEGVDIISVPDPDAFGAAADMTEVKGGDGKTGPDGRFAVMVATSGGGELRIGGGSRPVKRIPLPRPPVPLFDAGDVDLGRPIPIVVVLDRDPGCDLRAAGPVGRAGLQLVRGTRVGSNVFDIAIPEPGLWEFTLTCGRDAVSLHPSVVRIDAAPAGKEVRMIVR